MNQSRGRPQQGAARISASAGRKQGHAPPSGGFGRSPQDDAGEAAGGRGLSPGGPESGTGAGRFRLEGEEMASHEWIYWHVRPGPQGNRPHQQRYSQPRDLQQHPAGSDHPTEPFRIPCRRQRRGLLHPMTYSPVHAVSAQLVAALIALAVIPALMAQACHEKRTVPIVCIAIPPSF